VRTAEAEWGASNAKPTIVLSKTEEKRHCRNSSINDEERLGRTRDSRKNARILHLVWNLLCSNRMVEQCRSEEIAMVGEDVETNQEACARRESSVADLQRLQLVLRSLISPAFAGAHRNQ
jgi:hypothetical protein